MWKQYITRDVFFIVHYFVLQLEPIFVKLQRHVALFIPTIERKLQR